MRPSAGIRLSILVSPLVVLGIAACGDDGYAVDRDVASYDHHIADLEAQPAASHPEDAISDGAPATLTSCAGEVARKHVTVVDSNVTTDAEWRGWTYLSKPIAIEADATLTIEAGAHVVAAAGAGLAVLERAALLVDGVDAPVTFCGEIEGDSATPVAWSGIQIDEGADADTVLSGLLLKDAGNENLAALTLAGAATLQGVNVVHAAGDGVRASQFGDDSTGLSVSGSSGRAIVLDAEEALSNFPDTVELAGNGSDAIHLTFSEITSSIEVMDPGSPFYQAGNIGVSNGAGLLIDHGVEWIFGQGAVLEIGSSGESAGLFALGTSEEPISFRGDGDGKGLFGGIIVQDCATGGSILDHVEIRGGGADDVPPLAIRTPMTLHHVTVRDGARSIEIGPSGLDPYSHGLFITGSGEAPMSVAPDALVSLPYGDYTGNAEDVIRVNGGTFTANGTIPDLGVSFFVADDIWTTGDSVFHVAPGVQFLMGAETRLVFGAEGDPSTVILDGAEDEEIVFSGIEPTAGYWDGVLVGANISPESRISHTDFGFAGRNEGAALRLKAAIPVTDCLFHDWAGAALMAPAASLDEYAQRNTFVDMSDGDLMPL